MNYQEKMEEMISKIRKGTTPKLLLHACCAPCSSYCLEYLSNYFKITVYYYNPNIDTKEEFDKRVEELRRFTSEFQTKNPVNIVVENYDNSEYTSAIEGKEEEKEGSSRCYTCYELRMRKAAQYAKKNRFKYFTTTLSISPYKNSNWLNEIGEKLANEYDLKYLYADFKKKNGYKRSIELSKEYNLYRQDYCGCKYSKVERDNRERAKKLALEKQKEEEALREQLASFVNAKHNRELKSKKEEKDGMYQFRDIKVPVYKKLFRLIIIAAIIGLGGYMYHIKFFSKLDVSSWTINLKNGSTDYETDFPLIDTLTIKEEISNINEYYIYGNRLNIKGSLTAEMAPVKASIAFIGKKEMTVAPLKFEYKEGVLTYRLADKINDGYKLDDLPTGSYDTYIKIYASDGREYYYKTSNKSNHEETSYYTITSKEGKINKITFASGEDLKVECTPSEDDVYDIILDAGHGGTDSGAKVNGRWETQYTLPYTNKLKGYLEELGYKVALTRTSETKIPDYDKGGRVNKIHESNAKLSLSIHFNNVGGVNYHGFEFYCPYNSDLTFARSVSSSMNALGLRYSINKFNKVEEGIYIRTMDNDTLKEMQKDAVKKNYTTFPATNETNYYFMIREPGEYMTGAYRDGRDGTGVNYYINSNRGTEGYIFEIGYIGNNEDMTFIEKNNENILKKLASLIDDYLRK